MATPHVAGVTAVIWAGPDRDGVGDPAKLDAAVDDKGAAGRDANSASAASTSRRRRQ